MALKFRPSGGLFVCIEGRREGKAAGAQGNVQDKPSASRTSDGGGCMLQGHSYPLRVLPLGSATEQECLPIFFFWLEIPSHIITGNLLIVLFCSASQQ